MSAQHVVVRLLRDYARPHLPSWAAGTALLLVTNYLTVRIPLEIGAAVDALAKRADVSSHAAWIAAMGAAIIVVRTGSRVMFFNPGRDIEYQIRRDLFARLMALQPSFYAGQKTGDIVSRASNDITFARALIGFGVLQVVNVAFAVLMAGWKMLHISPLLTACAGVPVLLGLAVVQGGISKLFTLQRKNQAQLGALSDHVLGSFQGIATIQGFAAEEAFSTRFYEKNQEWFQTGMKLAVVRSLYFPMLAFAGGLGTFALLALGGPMALRGQLTVGDLAAFTALLGTLLPPLRSLGWLLGVMQRGRASLERIYELLDTPVDRPEGPAGLCPTPGRGPEIVLRNLSFAYPTAKDREILHDLQVTIPAGAVVGLFGRTGSGRTTLLQVLARLYNPPRGSVTVDGVDLLDLDLDAWRARLAVVPQRPFLFSESIAENVALDDPSPERVDTAVSLAALAPDLASLPSGLATVVGERGILLSGGQRQRVALARGLYRSPDVLLLDDVLSAVDHQTEQRLVESLRGLHGRAHPPTTLIVSHRISALRHADRILVMDDGRLVDQGTHAELSRRPGVYQDAWNLQREDGGGHE